jgi:hypothetical protein
MKRIFFFLVSSELLPKIPGRATGRGSPRRTGNLRIRRSGRQRRDRPGGGGRRPVQPQRRGLLRIRRRVRLWLMRIYLFKNEIV